MVGNVQWAEAHFVRLLGVRDRLLLGISKRGRVTTASEKAVVFLLGD